MLRNTGGVSPSDLSGYLRQRRWINQFVNDGVSLGSGKGDPRSISSPCRKLTGRCEFAFLSVEKTNAKPWSSFPPPPRVRNPVWNRETWEARESRLYIYIRRRCCEMNLSIQEESCLFCWRKGDERVGESFQPWNIIGIVFSCLFLVWFIFKKPAVVGFKRMFNIWFWNKVASSSRFYFSFYFSRGINVCYLCFLLILMARKD